MSKCITVLTRGYNNINDYKSLIKRNIHIAQNLVDKTIDILIFHENNITEEQQIYIKNITPKLNIKFINILNIAFHPNKKNIAIEEASNFGLGYRHMCSFWFVDFFDAVKDYDKILRIDEDCFIESNIDNIFLKLDEYIFICGKETNDEAYVTKGLNQFSIFFMKKHNNNFTFKTNDVKFPSGPYTNLIGFSLDQIRNNEAFQKYKTDIDNSNMIYKRRWGDLPLWGEVIYYIFGNETLKIDNTIKYFHGSHSDCVNFNTSVNNVVKISSRLKSRPANRFQLSLR